MTDSTLHRREEPCDCAIGTTCWDFWHTVGLLEGLGWSTYEARERAHREIRAIADERTFEKANPHMTVEPNTFDPAYGKES